MNTQKIIELSYAEEKIYTGFMEALLFGESDNSDESGGEPLDANYSFNDFAPSANDTMKKIVRAFWNDCYSMLNDENESYEQNGHDLYFTIFGHGVGFWDGDYPIHGDKLTDWCDRFQYAVHVTLGDDGLIYVDCGVAI